MKDLSTLKAILEKEAAKSTAGISSLPTVPVGTTIQVIEIRTKDATDEDLESPLLLFGIRKGTEEPKSARFRGYAYSIPGMRIVKAGLDATAETALVTALPALDSASLSMEDSIMFMRELIESPEAGINFANLALECVGHVPVKDEKGVQVRTPQSYIGATAYYNALQLARDNGTQPDYNGLRESLEASGLKDGQAAKSATNPKDKGAFVWTAVWKVVLAQ